MKNIFPILFIPFLSFSFLTACNEKGSQESNEKASATLDSNQEGYQPGSTWQLVWADEFNDGTLNEDNWNFQVEEAGRFNDEWQRYTNSSNNAYVKDDCLVIQAIHEGATHGMDQYTSARLHTANKQNWQYGKIVARMKLPYSQGIWPAFWMLGANINENGGDTPWPQSGEIDILELYGSKNDSIVEVNLHYANTEEKHASMGAVAYHLKAGKFADDFHIFELEWDAKQISWSVDGTTVTAFPIDSEELSEFHKPFFILFNIAVGGQYAGRPDDRSIFPQKMYIDWVRVYQVKDKITN